MLTATMVKRVSRWMPFGYHITPDAVGQVVGDVQLYRERVVRGQHGITGLCQLTLRVTGI